MVFIRELVSRRAIAFIARKYYGEPYTALPMRHSIDMTTNRIRVEYGWRREGRWELLCAAAEGQPAAITNGSVEEFIARHLLGLHGTRSN